MLRVRSRSILNTLAMQTHSAMAIFAAVLGEFFFNYFSNSDHSPFPHLNSVVHDRFLRLALVNLLSHKRYCAFLKSPAHPSDVSKHPMPISRTRHVHSLPAPTLPETRVSSGFAGHPCPLLPAPALFRSSA